MPSAMCRRPRWSRRSSLRCRLPTIGSSGGTWAACAGWRRRWRKLSPAQRRCRTTCRFRCHENAVFLGLFARAEGLAMTAQIALLPDGRLHLQHGPIDCLCRAWGAPGEVRAAYAQVAAVFGDVLPSLCRELERLRAPLPSVPPEGVIARAMHAACAPYADRFITPMAAVAGAVADYLLGALSAERDLARAYVNDGGDIAFHLAPGQRLRCGLIADLAAPSLGGVFLLDAAHPARGIATSGRACKGKGGRSFSFGIADAVTVLARTGAEADAAATVIANAVDLPGQRHRPRQRPRRARRNVGCRPAHRRGNRLSAGRGRARGRCSDRCKEDRRRGVDTARGRPRLRSYRTRH